MTRLSLFFLVGYALLPSAISAPDTWSTLESLPTPRNGHLGFVFEGHIYAIGGRTPATPDIMLSSNEVYVIDQDAWTSLTPMPTARYGSCGGAAYQNKFLWVAGLTSVPSFVVYSIVEVYDASSDTWTTGTNFPSTVDNAGMIGVGGTGFVFGGRLNSSPTQYQETTFAYSFDADTWSSKTSMPDARGSISIAEIGSHIYLFGGYCPAGDVEALHRYSIDNDAFTSLAYLPSRRNYPFGGSTSSYVYSVGGDIPGPGGSLDISEKYDVDADVWTSITRVPIPTYRGAFITSGTKLYCVAGARPGTDDNLHVYTMEERPMTAMVVGDPEFILFDGSRHHLYLHTGVFNIVSTPTLAVNIMVDVLANLPPEDNRVIVMVGVTALIDNSTVLLVTCGVAQDESVVSCSGRYVFAPSSSHSPSSQIPPTTPHWKSINSGAEVYVNGFTVQISAKRLTWIPSVTATPSFSEEGQRLDVAVTAPSSTRTLAGLLPDLQAWGKKAVQARLSEGLYEVESGCLLSPTVPASEGVFHNAAAIQHGW